MKYEVSGTVSGTFEAGSPEEAIRAFERKYEAVPDRLGGKRIHGTCRKCGRLVLGDQEHRASTVSDRGVWVEHKECPGPCA